MTQRLPAPRKLPEATLVLLASLQAASDALPWSQRRSAEIKMTREMLGSSDRISRQVGANVLARLQEKLL